MIFPRRSVVFCALLFASFHAAAQTTGGIDGRIVDATTQAGVPGAVVSASGPALLGDQNAHTDDNGEFELTQLPPGVYTLYVQREGYQAFSQEGLTVRLDRTIRVHLSILADTVTVAPVAIKTPRPLISVPTTQTGGTVSRDQMDLLPYGRDVRSFDQAALAVPGVVPDPLGLQMAGSQSLESRIVIDGIDTTEPAFNRQGTRLLQNFVEEIAVDTGGYRAEYGRSMGGLVHVVTRSGSNDYHGSAFLNVLPFEASRKDLANPGTTIRGKDSLRYDVDGGFELGGPVVRDRLWFYAGFAPQIVSRDIDRIVQAGSAAIGAKTYTATQSEFQYVGKLNFLAAADHSFALSAFGNPGTTSGVMVGPLGLDATLNGNESAFLGRGTTGANDVALRYFGKVLDRRLQIEAAVAWHHAASSVSPASVGGLSADQVRATPSVTYGPTINLLDPHLIDATTPGYQNQGAILSACTPTAAKPVPCPVTSYLTGGLVPQDSTASRLAAQLKLSNFAEGLGHHRLRYGIEVARDGYDVTRTYAGGMQAVLLSGGQLAVTAFARPDSANPSVPARDAQGNLIGTTVETATHQWSFAAFAQDSWSVADTVWLDLGVRVERQRMFGSAPIEAVGGGTLPAFELTSVMPRLGLSYDFTGRGLSRAYAFYGRFYESVPLDMADRALSARTSVQYKADATKCAPSGSFTAIDPRTCPASSPYTFSGATSGYLIDPDLHGSYDDQYSAGVQYQLLRDVVVGIDYTRKSLGRSIEDMSITGAQGGTLMVTNPGSAGAAGATIGTVAVPMPSRIYDGVTLALAKQFSQGYLLQASYTVSSLRGNYAGLFRPEGLQTDPNLTSEYDRFSTFGNKFGRLPGDTPQVFKLDAAYAYEYSPKITFTAGTAFRAIQGGTLSYLARDPTAPQAGPTETFVLPRGDAGRLPWQTTLDLRGGVTWALSPTYSAAVTLDLLNVLNRQSATAEDQRYSLDPSGIAPQPAGTPLSSIRNGAGQPVSVNPFFKSALAYTAPFAARIGLRLSF